MTITSAIIDRTTGKFTPEDDAKFAEALRRYNKAYINSLYNRATENMTNVYASKLQDDALAICKSPYHTPSKIRWGRMARIWLYEFVRLVRQEDNAADISEEEYQKHKDDFAGFNTRIANLELAALRI